MTAINVDDLTEDQRRSLLNELTPGPTRYERILTWLFLSAFVGFLPVLGAGAVHGEWGEQIYNGQLIISAVGVFGSTAAGALLLSAATEKDRNFRATIAVPAIVFAIAGAFLYQGFAGVDASCVESSTSPLCEDAHSLARVFWISGGMVLGAVLAGVAHAASVPEGKS